MQYNTKNNWYLAKNMCVCSSAQTLILEINELRYRVSEMESERLQYEKKLKSTKVSEAGVNSIPVQTPPTPTTHTLTL